MAKRENYEGIKKQVTELDKIADKIRKTKDRKKCQCDHQKNGELKLHLIKKNGQDGRKMAMCSECQKDDIEIGLQPCKPENLPKLDESIHFIDTTVDLIKIALNKENPDDLELLSSLAKFQFFLRNNLKDLAKGVSRRNEKAKRRNGNGGNHDDNTWGKPIVR